MPVFMRSLAKRLNREITAFSSGFTLTAKEIAKRVDRKVRRTKLAYDAALLEQEMHELFTRLGRRLHQLEKDGGGLTSQEDSEVIRLREKILESERRLERVTRTLSDPGVDAARDLWNRLFEGLFHGAVVLREGKIGPNYRSLGETVARARIPPRIHLLAIFKQHGAEPACGETRLELGDRIVAVGPEEELKKFLDSL